MVMRCSFALDPDLMEQIDQFAREHSLDRNEAILELIEAGLSCRMLEMLRCGNRARLKSLTGCSRNLRRSRMPLPNSRRRSGWFITRSRPTGAARQKGFRSRRNTPGSSGGSDLLTYDVCYAAEALAPLVVAEDGLNLCHIDIWRATAEAAVSPRR